MKKIKRIEVFAPGEEITAKRKYFYERISPLTWLCIAIFLAKALV